jgi:hypothetical protein
MDEHDDYAEPGSTRRRGSPLLMLALVIALVLLAVVVAALAEILLRGMPD